MKKYLLQSLSGIAVFLFFLFVASQSFANNSITVICDTDNVAINRKVFGQNIVAYEPKSYEKNSTKDFYGYSDYAAGLWDGKWGKPTKGAIELLKSSGATVLRFPGGCGSHNYDWKETIGKKREHFLFGLDEFLTVCKEVGAEPIITLSYFTGTPQDAADMVEYLNSPDDGKHPWAAKRAQNGHKAPYGVKYFEVGNEVWHGNHRDIKKVSPQEYAEKYLQFYNALKNIDSDIFVGAVFLNFSQDFSWDKIVASIIGERVDFVIIHTYPSPLRQEDIPLMSPFGIFSFSLAVSEVRDNYRFTEIKKLLINEKRRAIPIVVTEFNGGYVQDEPLPYRLTLGCALVNAELIRVMMKPENNILLACHWNFINEYWGMVANGFKGDYKDLYKPYYKRPNYYVFQVYKEHFGDLLLNAKVECDSYTVNSKDLTQNKLAKMLPGEEKKIPYLAVNASKSKDGKKVYLMVINKNLDKEETTTISLKDFNPKSEGQSWTLNGPAVDATNEKDHDNVKVTARKFKVNSNSFEYTFEPHSLTAIELGVDGK